MALGSQVDANGEDGPLKIPLVNGNASKEEGAGNSTREYIINIYIEFNDSLMGLEWFILHK